VISTLVSFAAVGTPHLAGQGGGSGSAGQIFRPLRPRAAFDRPRPYKRSLVWLMSNHERHQLTISRAILSGDRVTGLAQAMRRAMRKYFGRHLKSFMRH
jgi:hypothetical protein